MDISYVFEKIEDLKYEIIEKCTYHKPGTFGLDARAGGVYVCESFIATSLSRSLDYYGGMEYVDAEDTLQVGELKVYFSNSDRVQDVIDSCIGI